MYILQELLWEEGFVGSASTGGKALVKKIIANLAFLQATLDAESGKKVATPTNATGANNPTLATPTNATIANNPAPMNPTMVSTSKARPPELVDYGNDELFANLARAHDYYYEWRAQHLDTDVWDGSTAFVNFSTSQFTEGLEKCIWHETHVNHQQILPKVNMHKCEKIITIPIQRLTNAYGLWNSGLHFLREEPYSHVYSMMTTLGRRVCWQCEYRRQGIGQKNNCKFAILTGKLGC